jgi:hypothetical protein
MTEPHASQQNWVVSRRISVAPGREYQQRRTARADARVGVQVGAGEADVRAPVQPLRQRVPQVKARVGEHDPPPLRRSSHAQRRDRDCHQEQVEAGDAKPQELARRRHRPAAVRQVELRRGEDQGASDHQVEQDIRDDDGPGDAWHCGGHLTPIAGDARYRGGPNPRDIACLGAEILTA